MKITSSLEGLAQKKNKEGLLHLPSLKQYFTSHKHSLTPDRQEKLFLHITVSFKVPSATSNLRFSIKKLF